MIIYAFIANIFKKIFLLTAMTCTIAGIVFANANNTFQKQQAKGLADKNIEALLSNLSDNVELYFGSEGNVYSKTQAKIILQDYFQKKTASWLRLLASDRNGKPEVRNHNWQNSHDRRERERVDSDKTQS
jgi:hypothetical protein